MTCSKSQSGIDPLDDMMRFLPHDRPLIFDIGANVGQSVSRFRGQFPRSTIHSFEPSPTTFESLRKNAGTTKDVHLWNCAMGSSVGQLKFLENTHSVMSSFLPMSETAWGKVAKETLVDVNTIDNFRESQKIDRIDILKSDTQGFDLEVFKGAEKSMNDNKIGMVYFEIIFSEMYQGLPPFSHQWDFLISHGYSLVSFYQFYYQKDLASWTDALFVHKSILPPKT